MSFNLSKQQSFAPALLATATPPLMHISNSSDTINCNKSGPTPEPNAKSTQTLIDILPVGQNALKCENISKNGTADQQK